MSRNTQFILVLLLIVIVGSVVLPDKSTNSKSNRHHNGRKSPHYKQQSPNCDLVCPGQPPLPLPPNFLHNCTPIHNTTTQRPATPFNVTSPKPYNTTTNTTEESSEEEEDTDTTTKVNPANVTQSRNAHQQHHRQNKNHKQHQIKKHIRKEKVLLNRKAKSKLLKHKHMQKRTRLDGCYVICPEGNEKPVNPGTGPSLPNNPPPEEPDSEEDSDDENYVQGEDTPIEIIYVPQRKENNIRPVDIYQTNNYVNEMWEPPLAIPYGSDPVFLEDKKKKMKRKKHGDKKHEEKKNI
ncbi:uncharacterized protein LOC115889392 [Sitophilus oryzae]|uniref:Uncharacterized protein LOC115889392 n=1 Tax=Sitophilus oryzae TaxID=7048 RepID=A0A6J2YPF5_SITOR|nr:uncharacterized protein LOC115889392 [Sitophilus oryzae]